MTQHADRAPLLEAVGVRRSFDRLQALHGVDLRLHAGELVGLVGPDGAGKTTLIRAMVGLIRIDEGRARVRGTDWRDVPGEAREQLGYMPQHYGLYTDLSVDENLRFFGNLFDLPRKVFEERRDHLLGITQLTSAADRPAGKLSGGMYKKLAIACALLHRPSVLVLDEPTNGVDPVSRRELWALLHGFVEEGMGVLVSTPYMDEAARCDRVALMHAGRVLEEGVPSELLADFPHCVLEVHAADRSVVDRVLEDNPEVMAVTPAGERIRAVVRHEHRASVIERLEDVGASAAEATADFEDLVLALLAEEGDAG